MSARLVVMRTMGLHFLCKRLSIVLVSTIQDSVGGGFAENPTSKSFFFTTLPANRYLQFLGAMFISQRSLLFLLVCCQVCFFSMFFYVCLCDFRKPRFAMTCLLDLPFHKSSSSVSDCMSL